MRAPVSMTIIAVCFGLSGAADARRLPDSGTPETIDRLLGCRRLPEATSRLACFDSESLGVVTAIASRDLVVIDKERARIAGRSMFGFSIPNFGGLFGNGGAISSIEQKVASVSHNPYGGWLIKLDDGSVWNQTDDGVLGLAPRISDQVTVRRGALGSFVVSVRNQPGFKAIRIG